MKDWHWFAGIIGITLIVASVVGVMLSHADDECRSRGGEYVCMGNSCKCFAPGIFR